MGLEVAYGKIKEITKEFTRTIVDLKKWRSVDGKTWEEKIKEVHDSLEPSKRFRVRM
jgi:hypothetical protein